MSLTARLSLFFLGMLAVVLAGCSGTPTAPGTGADAAARGYFEALLRRDWAEAYAALHPDSRARCTA